MRSKLLLLLSCLFMAVGTITAQVSKVTGLVIAEEDGQPVVGASILVVGTQVGTITDMDGKFTLTGVPSGSKTLQISYIGMVTENVAIKNHVKVIMKSDSKAIDEVVVTAMGISRSQKTLGYSATTVKSDEITGSHTTNVANALSGKVAGLQVSATSSAPGASSNVVIRGFSSINGSNQPLYVVDGVPLQQSTASGQGSNSAVGGIANISSDDIASMTILKGAAATALYGSRASNGVIIITTKTGKKADGRNYSIEYSGSVQARTVAYLPEMQNDFGQGWNGNQTYIENGSWGPRLDGSLQIYGPIWNFQQRMGNYSALKSNVKDFFDTGWSQNHSISLSGASDDNKMTYYLSYSYAGDNGIMPTDQDSYKRNTIAFRSTYQPEKWLKLSSSINFARSQTDVVGTYQGTSVIDGLYELPRNISLVDMQDTSVAFNTPEAYFTPYGITNPYWALENNYNHTDGKQVYGKVQLDINPIKELTLTYRLGLDYTDYDRKIGYPQIDLDDALINDDEGYAPSNMNQDGYVYTAYTRKYEINHDFLANYINKFNKFDINVTAGLNINERYSTSVYNETDKLAVETGFWDLSNGSTKTTLEESQSKRRLVGLFGDLTLGYDDFLFLDLTARNDWSSTLPVNANSFFYPGATLSYIFTKHIPENKVLTFGKVRVAYGKTGNDADTYKTATSYIQGTARGYYGTGIASFPMNGVNAFQKSATAGSETLKPEMTNEFEVGLNLQFFDGRLGFDGAFYNRVTSDQIFTLPVDPSTGYSYKVTNFGKVRNRGIELLFTGTPVKTKNFRWDLGLNFAINKNKVLSLPESLEGGKVSLYDFSAGNDAVYMYAEEGKAMGEFYTYEPTYTEDGKMIVGSDGMPILTDTVQDTGKSINNKWTGGLTTSFSAYGFTLSAALDVRYGGYMFSRTKNLMQFTGNGIVTTYNNRCPFIIPNSVVENADGSYSENTTPIMLQDGSYQDYFNDYGYGYGGEAYLVSKSFAKLRNVSLTYSLPKKWVNTIFLRAVDVTLFCNNVFTWTAKDNYYVDPENTTVSVSSYGDLASQFGELYCNPSCRTWGLNLSVKF